ncbi:MAG: hypothetical protein ACXWA3_02980, partial [Acidimicrobiales bacterium]
GSVTWISPSGGRCTSALPGLRPEVRERIGTLLPFPAPLPSDPTPGGATAPHDGADDERLDPSGTAPP